VRSQSSLNAYFEDNLNETSLFAFFVFLLWRLTSSAFTIDSSVPTLRWNSKKHPIHKWICIRGSFYHDLSCIKINLTNFYRKNCKRKNVSRISVYGNKLSDMKNVINLSCPSANINVCLFLIHESIKLRHRLVCTGINVNHHFNLYLNLQLLSNTLTKHPLCFRFCNTKIKPTNPIMYSV
jgi:hypothetical protein